MEDAWTLYLDGQAIPCYDVELSYELGQSSIRVRTGAPSTMAVTDYTWECGVVRPVYDLEKLRAAIAGFREPLGVSIGYDTHKEFNMTIEERVKYFRDKFATNPYISVDHFENCEEAHAAMSELAREYYEGLNNEYKAQIECRIGDIAKDKERVAEITAKINAEIARQEAELKALLELKEAE